MRECLRVHKDVVVAVSLAGSAFTPTVGLRVTRSSSLGLRYSVGPKLPSGNVAADSSLFFATAAEHEIRTCERGTEGVR